MERCGFFDANLVGKEYDRVYLASSFAAYFSSFIGNGVFAKKSDKLQVVSMAVPSMQISVLPGQGFINGYWYENTDILNLPIDIADGVLNRIDSVVLRFGSAERIMWLAIKKGTPAITPVSPPITRNADYYELQLATINIAASSINVTQAKITDTRMDASVCGLVTGVVDQIDTTTLFAQFETYFQEFKDIYEFEYDTWTAQQKSAYITWITGQKADMENWTKEQKDEYNLWYNSHTTLWQTQFDTWFDNVKNQLSKDVAGQLQNQINAINEKLKGYTAGTTQFSDDGTTITQITEDGEKLKTTFVDSFTIVQEWINALNVVLQRKRIEFSQDGKTITETKEVI